MIHDCIMQLACDLHPRDDATSFILLMSFLFRNPCLLSNPLPRLWFVGIWMNSGCTVCKNNDKVWSCVLVTLPTSMRVWSMVPSPVYSNSMTRPAWRSRPCRGGEGRMGSAYETCDSETHARESLKVNFKVSCAREAALRVLDEQGHHKQTY